MLEIYLHEIYLKFSFSQFVPGSCILEKLVWEAAWEGSPSLDEGDIQRLGFICLMEPSILADKVLFLGGLARLIVIDIYSGSRDYMGGKEPIGERDSYIISRITGGYRLSSTRFTKWL